MSHILILTMTTVSRYLAVAGVVYNEAKEENVETP